MGHERGTGATGPETGGGEVVVREARRELASLVALLPRGEVMSCAAEIARTTSPRAVTPAKAGLGQVRLREQVLGDVFNLGEVCVSTATVALTLDGGRTVTGGATVMVDDVELARSAAVMDAAMAAAEAEWAGPADRARARPVLELLDRGRKVRVERDGLRRAMMVATRVDFALLNQDGGEGEGR